MKTFRKVLPIIFVLFLSLIIISCGGGGGGGGDTSGDTGTGTNTNESAPVIKDVRIFRQSTPGEPIQPSNGIVTVTVGEYIFFKIYYSDPDVNVDLAYFTRYYPSSRTEPTLGPDPVITTQSQVEDIFTSEPYLVGNFPGAWRLEFQIEDSHGDKSNTFTIFCDVRRVPPDGIPQGTGPVIKDVRIFRQSAPEEPIEPSEGKIVVNAGEYIFFKIYYSDPDVNVDLVYFARYYPSTRTVPTLGPDPIIITQLIAEDIFSSEPYLVGNFPGDWRLEFQVEDSYGNRSDIFTLYAEVT